MHERTISRRGMLRLGAAAVALTGAGMPATSHAAVPAVPDEPQGVRWITLRNGHKVWTQRVGSGPVKVLLLHGGPGFSHDYLQCFADFLPPAGYEIVFYDQLGCGRSDRPDDPSLWTLARYLDEVEEVRATLGLERFVLFGHSWGGILGIEYALRHPDRLSAFVLSNMTASIDDYLAYTTRLRAALPKRTREDLDRLEAAGDASGQEFNDIIMRDLYPRHVLRLPTWPEPVMKAFAAVNGDIYNRMQGANEFVFTGNLRRWNRWADLPRIATRTLVMGAANDEMDPRSIRREARLIPHADLFISKRGSHLTMWDDQQAYFDALLRFLGGASAA